MVVYEVPIGVIAPKPIPNFMPAEVDCVVAIYTGVAKTFSADVGQILLPSKYAFDLGAKLYRTR